MNEHDLVRLRSMVDSSKEVLFFIEDYTRESLEQDIVRQRALERSTELIGEAASKVSPEFQDANPQIPWAQIIGMRNRLIHGYLDINLDRLWETAQTAVPLLITELEKLLPPEEADET